jgi:hypothetical protein
MKADHYVGKLLNGLKENETILAIGPTKANPDGVLQMQPMLVATQGNWDDLLAINLFIATGGLGPIATEKELGDNTVTNRSLAWQDEKKETQWFSLSGWNKLSKEMAELPPGTPTIAVGSFTSSEREDKKYINYGVSKVLYLPRGSKAAPKKQLTLKKVSSLKPLLAHSIFLFELTEPSHGIYRWQIQCRRNSLSTATAHVTHRSSSASLEIR